jgi:hypothetical protein
VGKVHLQNELKTLQNDLTKVERNCRNYANKAESLQKLLTERNFELQMIREKGPATPKKHCDATFQTFKFMVDEKDVELEAIRNENQILTQNMNHRELEHAKAVQTLAEQKDAEISRLKFDLNAVRRNVKSPNAVDRSTLNKTASCSNLFRELQTQSDSERTDHFLIVYRKLLNEKEDQIDILQKRLQNVTIESTDETVEAYKFILLEKENELESLKKDFENKLREKQSLIERGLCERERLLIELETYKAKKDHIEKAITRQLKKTDRLLKKAKINLIET